jgi:DNA-binding NarL/FixJ family response regulator
VARVFLLEDHDAFRRCLALCLAREPDIEVAAEAGSLKEARDGTSRRWPEVDVAIVGLLLPDGIGTDLIADLRRAKPDLPVIVLTVLTQREAHNWAVKMGANEVITKESPLKELVTAIRSVGRGQNGAEPNPRDERRRGRDARVGGV